MAELPKRIASVILAMVFLFTSIGFSVFVIYQISTQDNAKTTTTPDQAQKTDCQFATPKSPTLPKPEVFKPTGKVTKLEVTDLVKGGGAEAKSGDCVTMKYYGTLVSGKIFDEDYSKPEGIQFQLGVGYVIPGWDQGLIGMKVGGTRRLVIPPALAYGDQAQKEIPANSTLVFTVKLVEITKP